MSGAKIIVLGAPATGKTHYAGQLLGRMRHLRNGILRLRPGGTDDLRHLEEVLDCLEDGRSAGHTPSQTWVGMKWELETLHGSTVELQWPEYAGERLSTLMDNRRIETEWRESIAAAQGWMLFLRPTGLVIQEDVLSRPALGIPTNQPGNARQVLRTQWDDRARYVELLQMLLFVSGRSTYQRISHPRLAIIMSCWDELEENGSTPMEVFEDRLPLVHAFVRSTWSDSSWSVWGLSSLGRALRPDTSDPEFLSNGPENFGYVIPPESAVRDDDLTAPVAWLLDL